MILLVSVEMLDIVEVVLLLTFGLPSNGTVYVWDEVIMRISSYLLKRGKFSCRRHWDGHITWIAINFIQETAL